MSVMVVEPIHCPACQGTDVVKHGKTSDGKQRFRCQNETCPSVTFIREYVYQGRIPAVKRQMIDMSLNASGSRDIARVLHISPTTVIQELKKRAGTARRQSQHMSV
jgi:transposase-like protein